MIALLGSLLLQATQPSTVRGSVRDASTHAPLASAIVAGPTASVRTDDDGRFVIGARSGDTLRVARVGYRPSRVIVAGESLHVALSPAALRLEEVAVRDSAEAVRLAASREAERARADGALTTADAASALPFVSARGGRAGLSLSMRGSRPEQVLVLMDGVPLNDPATGAADLTDVPLVALGAVAAVPGTDASRYGSGASGGVLALSSGAGSIVAASGGSFGARTLEARSGRTAGAWRLHGGGGWSASRNDYPLVIDRSRQGLPDSTATREDADEERLAVFGGASNGRFAATAFASRVERGLARPVEGNSAALREDRRRLLARAQLDAAGWSFAGGARVLDLDYRDPEGVVSPTRATSRSLDLEASRELAGVGMRAGVGTDRVEATSLRTVERPRGFVSLAGTRTLSAVRVDAALRGDAVRGAGVHLSPSLSAAWRLGALQLHGRAAQGFRAPSFHDLYVASAVSASARDVRPERVLMDAEAGVRVGGAAVSLAAAGFVRHTRDAIVWLPGSFSWSPHNVERERVRGAEARLLAAHGMLSVEGWAGAYHTRALIDGYDVPTPYAPQAAGGAVLRASHRALELVGSLSALGRRQYVTAPAARALELPGVALLDLTLSHRARLGTARLLSTAGVRNAGDVRWEPVRRFPAPGRSWILGITITS